MEQEVADRREGVIFQLGSMGEVLTNPDCKNELFYKTVKEKASDQADILVERKCDIICGMWNVRSLSGARSLLTL